jgi:hypothetical protein
LDARGSKKAGVAPPEILPLILLAWVVGTGIALRGRAPGRLGVAARRLAAPFAATVGAAGTTRALVAEAGTGGGLEGMTARWRPLQARSPGADDGCHSGVDCGAG